MGLAPISPASGALPWATTAIGEEYAAAAWYVVAEDTAISTAAPYIGYAAIGAAYHNTQNIACIDHTKQYFVFNSIQWWLDISAIIVLVCIYVIGGDGHGGGYADDGVGNLDVGGYGVGIANGNFHGMMM